MLDSQLADAVERFVRVAPGAGAATPGAATIGADLRKAIAGAITLHTGEIAAILKG